jgi:outer membrane autotransporter protein
MKIVKSIILSILILLIIPSVGQAQLFKLGVGGGLTQIVAPDIVKKDVSEGGFGFSTNWNLGLVAKVDLPIVPITPRAYLLYHSLSGSGDVEETLTKSTNISAVNVENSQTIFEVGVGAQYNFVPIPAGIDPYLALDIAMNSFGKLKVNNNEIPESNNTRFGGGVGLGAEVSIVPMVNIDLYLSYKLLNLVGKDEGEDTISAVTLDAFIMFNFL